jgi:hypothetical protein
MQSGAALELKCLCPSTRLGCRMMALQAGRLSLLLLGCIRHTSHHLHVWVVCTGITLALHLTHA